MSDVIEIKDKFPQGDPRVVVGAQVTHLDNGEIQAIGRIAKITNTQIQAEGLYPHGASACNQYRWRRDTGKQVGAGVNWSGDRIRLTTDMDHTEFQVRQEQRAKLRVRQEHSRADRQRNEAANADARLRWFAEAIRAAADTERGMELLREFASQIQVEGLGSDWTEPGKPKAEVTDASE